MVGSKKCSKSFSSFWEKRRRNFPHQQNARASTRKRFNLCEWNIIYFNYDSWRNYFSTRQKTKSNVEEKVNDGCFEFIERLRKNTDFKFRLRISFPQAVESDNCLYKSGDCLVVVSHVVAVLKNFKVESLEYLKMQVAEKALTSPQNRPESTTIRSGYQRVENSIQSSHLFCTSRISCFHHAPIGAPHRSTSCESRDGGKSEKRKNK